MVDFSSPVLPIDRLNPRSFRVHIAGQGIEGAKNGNGYATSTDFSGGGSIAMSMEVQGADGLEHELISWIDARLNGSFRFMNVPILNDRSGLFPLVNGLPFTTEPHTDGQYHDDGEGYSVPSVYGEVTEDAPLNAGILSLNVYGAARELRHSDWFAIYSDQRGWRAYRYWKVLSRSLDGISYRVAISPALRAAVTAGTRVEFVRPMCVMKFPSGFTAPWEVSGKWVSRPIIEFVEAF